MTETRDPRLIADKIALEILSKRKPNTNVVDINSRREKPPTQQRAAAVPRQRIERAKNRGVPKALGDPSGVERVDGFVGQRQMRL